MTVASDIITSLCQVLQGAMHPLEMQHVLGQGKSCMFIFVLSVVPHFTYCHPGLFAAMADTKWTVVMCCC